MRCDRCGKNEATFYYKSNINGKVTQVHLCHQCAEELGYTDSFRSAGMTGGLFGDFLSLRDAGAVLQRAGLPHAHRVP